jgi:hypothetical protein
VPEKISQSQRIYIQSTNDTVSFDMERAKVATPGTNLSLNVATYI